MDRPGMRTRHLSQRRGRPRRRSRPVALRAVAGGEPSRKLLLRLTAGPEEKSDSARTEPLRRLDLRETGSALLSARRSRSCIVQVRFTTLLARTDSLVHGQRLGARSR